MKKKLRPFVLLVEEARERMLAHGYRLERHGSRRRRHLAAVASDRWSDAVDNLHRAEHRFGRNGVHR